MRPGRIRGIKPEYFNDENVSELSLASAFLFPGLWTIADREGRFRDRPREIQGVLVPLRTDVDVGAVLAELALHGFVHRYEVEGYNYVQIVNWKHQHINVREPASEIPAPDPEQMRNVKSRRTGTCTLPHPSGTSSVPAPHVQVPDEHVHALPIRDRDRDRDRDRSHSRRNANREVQARASTDQTGTGTELALAGDETSEAPFFDRWWVLYPRKIGKAEARKAWARLRVDYALFERMHRTLEAQCRSPDWVRDGGRFIPNPATWLNGKRWEDEGTALPTVSEATAHNVEVGQRWLDRKREEEGS